MYKLFVFLAFLLVVFADNNFDESKPSPMGDKEIVLGMSRSVWNLCSYCFTDSPSVFYNWWSLHLLSEWTPPLWYRI